MPEDRLMSIGGFAQQCGLSVPALRYYDEIELLEPISVDPSSGYRRYHPDQLAAARQIYILRALELPIEAVREVVGRHISLRAAVESPRDRRARQTRALDIIAAAVDNDDNDDDNDVINHYLSEFIQPEGRPMSAQTICRPFRSPFTPTTCRGQSNSTATCSAASSRNSAPPSSSGPGRPTRSSGSASSRNARPATIQGATPASASLSRTWTACMPALSPQGRPRYDSRRTTTGNHVPPSSTTPAETASRSTKPDEHCEGCPGASFSDVRGRPAEIPEVKRVMTRRPCAATIRYLRDDI